jgi:hypothetical protein
MCARDERSGGVKGDRAHVFGQIGRVRHADIWALVVVHRGGYDPIPSKYYFYQSIRFFASRFMTRLANFHRIWFA